MRITLPNPKRFSKILKSVTNIPLNQLVTGICTDSRQCLPGDLYIAIKGNNVDGHYFIKDAQKAGATAVLSTDDIEFETALQPLRVRNVIETIGVIANKWRKQFNIPTIAITGSNGKTTTKELTKHILQSKFNVHFTKGNFNTAIGLPLTLLLLEEMHEFSVLEMGANQPGDIKYLCKIAEPTGGLITNIGPAHLEGFGSIENVLTEKSELFRYLNKGLIFKNISDSYIKTIPTSTNTIDYGCESECKYNADFIREKEGNIILKINTNNLILNSKNLVFAKNVLAASVIANSFGIDWETIQSKLNNFTPTYGRSVITKYGKITVIDDTYNANYTSTIAALDNLDLLTNKKRKIFVFGDMSELGDYSKEYHQKVGQKCNELRINAVFTIGSETLNTHRVLDKVTISRHFNDQNTLVSHLKINIKDGDTILFKGSRNMEIEKIIQKVFKK
jgi:UDP-N-acetylmuramoyl-tripeptide--D-alanyl-D-alanine ligase